MFKDFYPKRAPFIHIGTIPIPILTQLLILPFPALSSTYFLELSLDCVDRGRLFLRSRGWTASSIECVLVVVEGQVCVCVRVCVIPFERVFYFRSKHPSLVNQICLMQLSFHLCLFVVY